MFHCPDWIQHLAKICCGGHQTDTSPPAIESLPKDEVVPAGADSQARMEFHAARKAHWSPKDLDNPTDDERKWLDQ